MQPHELKSVLRGHERDRRRRESFRAAWIVFFWMPLVTVLIAASLLTLDHFEMIPL